MLIGKSRENEVYSIETKFYIILCACVRACAHMLICYIRARWYTHPWRGGVHPPNSHIWPSLNMQDMLLSAGVRSDLILMWALAGAGAARPVYCGQGIPCVGPEAAGRGANSCGLT